MYSVPDRQFSRCSTSEVSKEARVLLVFNNPELDSQGLFIICLLNSIFTGKWQPWPLVWPTAWDGTS